MSSNKNRDIFDLLSESGKNLSSEEKETCRVLLRMKNPASADEISSVGGIQKAKVYAALKRLVEKEIVVSTSLKKARPGKFQIVKPEKMKDIIDNAKQQFNETSEKMYEDYKEQYGEGSIISEPRFEYISGRNKFYLKAIELVKNKPVDMFIISRRGQFYSRISKPKNHNNIKGDVVGEFGNILRDYLTKGGQLYALVSSVQDQLKIVEEIKKEFQGKFDYAEIDTGPYQGVSALIGKNEVLLGWNQKPEEGTNEGIYIEDLKIYEFIRTMFQFARSNARRFENSK